MKPFFSIIVPCCDVEPYVRECLDSVLNQPFADWECLLGVEISKDKTEEIARAYAEREPRFRVFTGPRSGSCSASRNTGTDMAQGEYVIFLDGDDTIAEGSLQRLHDKIAAHPGADIYPCAMKVYDDASGRELELRDNYPPEAPVEMTGTEATLTAARHRGVPCPMLQLSVFRRGFLADNGLKCIHGLRRQDSEFSPRALYLAKRVVPLHDQFYLYRIRPNAVGSSARGAGYFHKDWATIIRSLLSFHAAVSREPGFDRRVAATWAVQWTSWLFYFWFDPKNVKTIPRELRVETLCALFRDGFEDLHLLLRQSSRSRRIAGRWVCAFVRHPFARKAVETLFALYFALSKKQNGGTGAK